MSPWPIARSLSATFDEAAREAFDAKVAALQAKSPGIEATLLVGTPAVTITGFVAANGIDLVVAGTPRRSAPR